MILLSVCSLAFSKPLSSCWFQLPAFSCSYSTSYLLSACVKISLPTFFYVLCEEHSSLYANVSYTKELVLDVVKETCFKYNKNQTWVFQSCWHPTTVFLFPIKEDIWSAKWIQLQRLYLAIFCIKLFTRSWYSSWFFVLNEVHKGLS